MILRMNQYDYHPPPAGPYIWSRMIIMIEIYKYTASFVMKPNIEKSVVASDHENDDPSSGIWPRQLQSLLAHVRGHVTIGVSREIFQYQKEKG